MWGWWRTVRPSSCGATAGRGGATPLRAPPRARAERVAREVSIAAGRVVPPLGVAITDALVEAWAGRPLRRGTGRRGGTFMMRLTRASLGLSWRGHHRTMTLLPCGGGYPRALKILDRRANSLRLPKMHVTHFVCKPCCTGV